VKARTVAVLDQHDISHAAARDDAAVWNHAAGEAVP